MQESWCNESLRDENFIVKRVKEESSIGANPNEYLKSEVSMLNHPEFKEPISRAISVTLKKKKSRFLCVPLFQSDLQQR